MKEIILIHPTPEGSEEILVTGEKFSFGRGSDVTWRIADDGLSRLNSTIYRDGDNVWIVDENSTNGTLVNGEPVSSSGTPLRNNDSIRVGNFTDLRVRISEKQVSRAAAGGGSKTVSSAGSDEPASLTNLLPIVITAFAILLISISAVFIVIKASGYGSIPVATTDPNKDPGIDDPEDPPESPTPKKSPSPDKTAGGTSTPANENTDITNLPTPTPGKTPVILPSKKYLEMSDTEKRQYVQVKAEKVASLIGNRNDSSITPLAIDRIKGFLDAYAKRANVGRMSGCKFGDNLQATYERASKNAPFIIKAFNSRQVDPQIGLYLAMIESEHCVCLQSPTGPLGMFQFTYATAKLHFKGSDNIVKGANTVNSDDRCKPEPAANAAASYMKFLTGRYGTGPASVPLAIGSYNSGEGGLSSNLETALNANQSMERDFWTLIANSDKLSKQFQAENFKYVPKFFAAAIVGENPGDFGLSLQPLSTYTQ